MQNLHKSRPQDSQLTEALEYLLTSCLLFPYQQMQPHIPPAISYIIRPVWYIRAPNDSCYETYLVRI